MERGKEDTSSRTHEASSGKAKGVSLPLARPKGNYFSEEGLVISLSRTATLALCDIACFPGQRQGPQPTALSFPTGR